MLTGRGPRAGLRLAVLCAVAALLPALPAMAAPRKAVSLSRHTLAENPRWRKYVLGQGDALVYPRHVDVAGDSLDRLRARARGAPASDHGRLRRPFRLERRPAEPRLVRGRQHIRARLLQGPPPGEQ